MFASFEFVARNVIGKFVITVRNRAVISEDLPEYGYDADNVKLCGTCVHLKCRQGLTCACSTAHAHLRNEYRVSTANPLYG